MHPFDLYELCVTDAPRLARFLAAVHGKKPRTLREDFSGTGALARAWAGAYGDSVAVDSDPKPLARAKAPGVRAVRADATRCRVKADIIAATNFPLGYFHERASLVAYLRHARSCLKPRGVLLADLYGGRDAMRPMQIRKKARGPAGQRVDYTWEQREADPTTNLVLDALSFVVTPKEGKAKLFPDAFVYHWRLWSIPELRDAMIEAGFRRVEVYSRMGDAIDSDGNLYVSPHDAGEPLDDNYVVYVVGRK
jgi:SAM-dependent methyltransferase